MYWDCPNSVSKSMTWIFSGLQASRWFQFQLWEPLAWINSWTLSFLTFCESAKWEVCNVCRPTDLEVSKSATWSLSSEVHLKAASPVWEDTHSSQTTPILSSVCFFLGSPSQTSKIFSGSMCESGKSRYQLLSILWVSPAAKTVVQRHLRKVKCSIPLRLPSFLVGTLSPISSGFRDLNLILCKDSRPRRQGCNFVEWMCISLAYLISPPPRECNVMMSVPSTQPDTQKLLSECSLNNRGEPVWLWLHKDVGFLPSRKKKIFQNQSVDEYSLLTSTMGILSSLGLDLRGLSSQKMHKAAQKATDS